MHDDFVRIDIQADEIVAVRYRHGDKRLRIIGDVRNEVVHLDGLAFAGRLLLERFIIHREQTARHDTKYLVPGAVGRPGVIAPVHAFPCAGDGSAGHLVDDRLPVGLPVASGFRVHIENSPRDSGITQRVVHRDDHRTAQLAVTVHHGHLDGELRVVQRVNLHRDAERVPGLRGDMVLIGGVYLLPVLVHDKLSGGVDLVTVADGVVEQGVLRPVYGFLRHVVDGNHLDRLSDDGAHHVEGYRFGGHAAIHRAHVGGDLENARLSRMGDGIVIGGLGIDMRADVLIVFPVVPATDHRHVQHLVHISTYIKGKRDRSGISGPPSEVPGVDGQRGQDHRPHERGGRDLGHFPGHFHHDAVRAGSQELGHVNGGNAGGVDIHLPDYHVVAFPVLYGYLAQSALAGILVRVQRRVAFLRDEFELDDARFVLAGRKSLTVHFIDHTHIPLYHGLPARGVDRPADDLPVRLGIQVRTLDEDVVNLPRHFILHQAQ